MGGFKANVTTTNELPPEVREALRSMVGQLPIVFALRAGGKLTIPIAEIDATGGYILGMEFDQAGRTVTLEAKKKQ